MPPLFAPTLATGPDYKLRTETNHEFFCRCGRRDVVAARERLEGWFSRFPEKVKPQWLGRFRGAEVEYKAAFYELYLHELLLLLGYEVEAEVPPPDGRPERIDFLVKKGGTRLFYVEATVAADEADARAEENRMGTVLDGLDRIDSPYFWLSIETEGDLGTSPSTRVLRKQLERWLARLDADALWAAVERDPHHPRPCCEHSLGGMKVRFKAHPKPPAQRGKPTRSPIAYRVGELVRITSDEPIVAAVMDKAEKYGRLDLPLIVAVNSLDETCSDHMFMDALFGTGGIQYTATERGEILNERPYREANGALRGPEGWRSRRASAVLLSPSVGPWTCATKTPILFHHPHPEIPLPKELWPLPQRVPNHQTGRLDAVPGKEAPELFAIIPPA